MRNSFQIASSINCDVLIIGAGGAGLRCAAEIFERRPGARVVAVTKVGHPQKSHTKEDCGVLVGTGCLAGKPWHAF
jgi:succinate dehydrogenase / fumarate reductase flavoprotein subunit